jgi:hypothetical protein
MLKRILIYFVLSFTMICVASEGAWAGATPGVTSNEKSSDEDFQEDGQTQEAHLLVSDETFTASLIAVITITTFLARSGTKWLAN